MSLLNMSIKKGSQAYFVRKFFLANPNRDITVAEVVDWVRTQYKKKKIARHPDKPVRDLFAKQFLIKIKKGVYRYDPEFFKNRDLEYFTPEQKKIISEKKIWTREETVVAFNLFCKIPFKDTRKVNPAVIELAEIIGRSPSSVAMKLGNFGRLDAELSEQGITGLKNGAKLEEKIWKEFEGNWDDLAYQSELLLQKFKKESDPDIEKNITVTTLPIGADRQQSVKARVNQSFFRTAVLSAYNGHCCISRLNMPPLLIASHIKPWALSDAATERTNPRNGLCLSAIYDRAFDAGLMTIDPDYRVVLSKSIKVALPKDVVAHSFLCYEGKKIDLPERFKPLANLLTWHNENIFIDG